MPAANPPIIFLSSVDSTNNYAMAQVHAGLASSGMAWFAREQYAGKGQRSKQWMAAPGENITMSIALQPTFLEPAQPFLLSASVALAVHDFFSDYAGDETKIKWPNDLYWRDRKAGGILIENLIGSNSSSGKDNQKPSTAGNIKWSIIGIGININQTYFPDFLPNPVSLKQITGKTFDTFQLAGELQQKVLNRFEQLKTEGFHNIYEAYIKESYRMHQPQKFKKENRVLEATIKNITPAGQLVLQHAIEEVYDFGEVEWVTLKNT